MRMHMLISLLLVGLGLNGFSMSDPVATRARAINLNEVVEQIKYPLESRSEGVEGRVTVVLKVDEQGKVIENQVISSPCQNLSESIEKAVVNLAFEPAKDKTGNPIASVVKMPFDFELDVDR